MVFKKDWKFIIGLVVLTLLLLYPFKFFIDSLVEKMSLTGNVVGSPDLFQNLLIPSAITSIIFSILGLMTMIFLIYQIRVQGAKKLFPFRGYLAAISIVFIIFFINYFITLFPYGNLVLQIISFVLQIMIYGILLPYIFVAQIAYIILLLKEDIKGVLN